MNFLNVYSLANKTWLWNKIIDFQWKTMINNAKQATIHTRNWSIECYHYDYFTVNRLRCHRGDHVFLLSLGPSSKQVMWSKVISCQFNQHFTSRFCANILLTKNYEAKLHAGVNFISIFTRKFFIWKCFAQLFLCYILAL